jgi:hypothetical protein
VRWTPRLAEDNEGGPPTEPRLNPPSPARQVFFHQLLLAARSLWLSDALSETLGQVDQETVQAQIRLIVPSDVRKILAAAGLREDHIFPVPVVIKIKPSLVGYFRLLLGAPQKSFYNSATGMGRFKSMEELGSLSSKQEAYLEHFCRAMSGPLSELVRQIPDISRRDLDELPLLTFGAQLQGSNNTRIGKTAMKELFLAIKDLVAEHIVETQERRIVVQNAAGRIVHISLAQDPDVAVVEIMSDKSQHRKVAIEVKGGTDVSNVHNRAGEAEKSHQKARRNGFPEFWTVISKQGLQVSKLQRESPTTNHWFDLAQLLAREGPDWSEFSQRLAGTVGVRLEM